MRRVLPPENIVFEARVSPALALLHILPLIDLAPRFPGVDPWLARLAARLGREARADVRLITVPLSGAARYLLEVRDRPDSCEPALAALAAAPPDEVRRAVLAGLAERLNLAGPDEVTRRLHDDPEGLLAAMQGLELPTREEAYPVDWDRALRLLRQPEELKALVLHRLGSLWHDHLAPRWRRRLAELEQAAAVARRHFARGAPDLVFRAVTGRELAPETRAAAAEAGRIVFCPNPFLGPYVSLLGPDPGPDGRPALWVGYGTSVVPAAGEWEAEGALPGGLPAALAALADEGRLRLLAYAAQRGEVSAAEIMGAFGWTQPTTSRQLRQLVSTGWLIERRVDRVKWYRVDPTRAGQVAAALRGLLEGGLA